MLAKRISQDQFHEWNAKEPSNQSTNVRCKWAPFNEAPLCFNLNDYKDSEIFARGCLQQINGD
jgi:hypothetical protein